jgi:hypothetical protein
MASLQSLSAEILDCILTWLPIPDLVNLWRWSLMFHQSAARLLFQPLGLSHAMMWACKTGDVKLIQTALRHGANVHHVRAHVSSKTGDQKDTPYAVLQARSALDRRAWTFSTLALAARHQHTAALHMLLCLGARLKQTSARDRRFLRKQLRKPDGWNVLGQFIRLGLFFKLTRALERRNSNAIDLLMRGAPVWILALLHGQGVQLGGLARRLNGTLISPMMAVSHRKDEAYAVLLVDLIGDYMVQLILLEEQSVKRINGIRMAGRLSPVASP